MTVAISIAPGARYGATVDFTQISVENRVYLGQVAMLNVASGAASLTTYATAAELRSIAAAALVAAAELEPIL